MSERLRTDMVTVTLNSATLGELRDALTTVADLPDSAELRMAGLFSQVPLRALTLVIPRVVDGMSARVPSGG